MMDVPQWGKHSYSGRKMNNWNIIPSLGIVVIGLMLVEGEYVFKITPHGDIFRLRGSSLELNCTVNDSSYNVDQMGIGRHCQVVNGGQVENCTQFDSNLFKRFGNDTEAQTLSLKLSNVTLNDDGMYTCYYGNPPMFQTGKIVHVGELPSKPQNLSCISHNFNDLVCTASLFHQPSHIPMQWKMNYTVDGDIVSSDCTVVDSTITCEPLDSNFYFPHQDYRITLVGSNKSFQLDMVSETFITQLNYSIVKPDPVYDLRVLLNDHSSRNVEVVWEAPQELFASRMVLVYRIKLVSLDNWEPTQTMELKKELIQGQDSLSYNFTGLIPHANYDVSVLCKPETSHGDIYWSNTRTVTFQTNTDIPGASVGLVSGSYYYTLTNDSNVQLVVYWKNPSDKESHGDINRYQLMITDSQTNNFAITTDASLDIVMDHPPTETYRIKPENGYRIEVHGSRQSYLVEPVLNMSSGYTVFVWAGNDAGFSTESAELFIPTLDEVINLQPRWVLVEIDSERDRTLVSWDQGSVSEGQVTTVTIYWCNAGLMEELALCKDIDWQRVEFENNSTWINQSSDMQFAVSMETANNISGGLVWQSLQFKYNAVPKTPAYSVNADLSNGTMLYVTVTHGGLESSGGRPNVYEVVWNKVHDGEEIPACPIDVVPTQFPVDFSAGTLSIPGLQPGFEYVVCLRCVNDKGTGSFGKPVQIRTSALPGSPKGVNDWLIGVSGLASAVFLICLILLYCWCRRKMRSVNLNNQIADIEISDKFEMPETIIEMKPENHDSGTGSASSSDSPDRKDSGEGFIKPRSWSRVSNDSDSSAITGYIRVDGDLSAGYEKDSLLGETVNDGDEKGEVNEYFEARPNGRHAYQEIDEHSHESVNIQTCYDNKDLLHLKTEGTAYVPEADVGVTVRNPTTAGVYLDTVVGAEGNTLDNQGNVSLEVVCGTTTSSSSLQPEGMERTSTEMDQVQDNNQCSSKEISDAPNPDLGDDLVSHLNNQSPLTSECSESFHSKEPLTESINASITEQLVDIRSNQPSGYYTHEIKDASLPGNTVEMANNVDRLCKNTPDTFVAVDENIPAIAGVFESMVDDMNDSDTDEDWNDVNDDFELNEPHDNYCNPDSISIGQESTLSSASAITKSDCFSGDDVDYLKACESAIGTNNKQLINDENTSVHGDSVTVNDNHFPNGTIQNIAKAHQLSLDKPSLRHNAYDNTNEVVGLALKPRIVNENNTNSNNANSSIQSGKSNLRDNKLLSESGQSCDTYVCARNDQSS